VKEQQSHKNKKTMLRSWKKKLVRAGSQLSNPHSGDESPAPSSYYSSAVTATNSTSVVPSNTTTTTTTSGGDRTALKLSKFGRGRKRRDAEQQAAAILAQLTQRVDHLSAFDAAVQAADQRASQDLPSTSTNTTATSVPDNHHTHDSDTNDDSNRRLASDDALGIRRDPQTGLVDCSVLVSQDGNLLLIPPPEGQLGDSSDMLRSTTDVASDDDESESNSKQRRPSVFSKLISQGKDDYETAVFYGHDFSPKGDKALNGFSGQGWSIPASSYALQQTLLSLEHVGRFAEDVILHKKEAAARTHRSCEDVRQVWPLVGGMAPVGRWDNNNNNNNKTAWEVMDPRAMEFDPTSVATTHPRVGPFLASSSQLAHAWCALEDYYNTSAEKECQRWRTSSPSPTATSTGTVTAANAPLPVLYAATEQVRERSTQRQQALMETLQRIVWLEQRLLELKQDRHRQWQAVYAAEDAVSQKMAEVLQERHQLREKKQYLQWQNNNNNNNSQSNNGNNNNDMTSNQSLPSEEIWNLVSAMDENSSFEPLQFPPRESDPDVGATGSASHLQSTSSISSNSNPSSPRPRFETDEPLDEDPTSPTEAPVVSREQWEHELGVPALRRAALAADDAVEDAAGTLLNLLSNLDTTRRSARIVTETCLLTAGKAQLTCLQSLVALERAALEERLRDLQPVEAILETITMQTIRQDLDTYICADKKERGGTYYLGEDDDGGIASALAVLSSHVDGLAAGSGESMNHSGMHDSNSNHHTSGEDDEFSSTSREKIDAAVETLFVYNSRLESANDASTTNSNDPQVIQARKNVQDAVAFLSHSAGETSPSGRMKRSTICYALNSRRSSHAEIKSRIQFEGLCQLFAAILTGCHAEERGVSNAKMCMMLAQTFYIKEEASSSSPPIARKPAASYSPVRTAREKRIYIKSRLYDHPIWSKDDFW
jgi:hypothetical protein